MKALLLAAACTGALVLASPARVEAHEIGTTRVSAVFHNDRRYEVEIVTDAAALLEKLDIVAGQETEPKTDLAPAALGARLAALEEVFRGRVLLAFDGVADRPAIGFEVAPPADAVSPPSATIRLTGDVPPTARTVTWTYSWTFASYALSMRLSKMTTPVTEWLDGGQTSAALSLLALPPAPSRLATIWRYIALGFTHIVPHGLDHMLFVVGIFLLSRRLRSVLWQVSAFTLAHSITLALSIYGVVAMPSAIVEPLIALSIAYVAIENLFQTELRPWRIALVFAFGLLHGLGFAGALTEVGLPRGEYLTALTAFNVGVEAGQLAVIAAALVLVGRHASDYASYRRRVVVPVSMLIAGAAVYWTVERVGF